MSSRSEETPPESLGVRSGEAQAAPATPIPLVTPVPLSPPFAAVDLAADIVPCRPEEAAAVSPRAPAPELGGVRPVAPTCPLPRLGGDASACGDALAFEGTRYTGDLLRRVREARGITIVQLCERTKIPRSHMENLEADRYEKLPAPVYLRGILMALAKELRLDGQRVARSYLDEAAVAPKRGA